MTDRSAPTFSKATAPFGQFGARLLKLSLRLIPAERHRLFALTIIIGGVCGLLAVLFHSAIAFAERWLIDPALNAKGKWFVIGTLAVPTLGALVSGAMLHFFARNARGSGIPQVKVAYVATSGRVRLRDAFYKFFLSALQIGTGSALGREGPTVQICAGVATALGRLFAISPQNRRRLLPVGAAAGVAAAFNAPIAAVTFVTEEIIGDLDQTLLSGVVVAAALAAVIERSLLGANPIFNVPRDYGLEHASSLVSYALLGCAAAPFSHAFYTGMLGARGFCKTHGGRLGWAWPSVGGFSTGALALLTFWAIGKYGVTGDGYATLSEALRGNLPLLALLTLAGAKFLATSLCYATGGAGGLFAPVLFMGAMLGGSFGQLDRLVFAHSETQLGAFALVGMGALFAAVIRAPITSVLIIFEMTGNYNLVLPLMIANSVSYVIARRLYPTPIYEALLEQDNIHLPQPGRAASGLANFHVSDAMTMEVVTLAADDSIETAGQRIAGLPYSVYPIVEPDGRLLGLISDARVRRRLASGDGKSLLREQARPRESLRADQPLVEAVLRMHRVGARQMAVVSDDDNHLCGMLAMSDVMRAHVAAADGTNTADAARESWLPRPAVAWPARDTAGHRASEVSDSEWPPPRGL